MADSRITTTLDVRYVGQPALTEMERSFVTGSNNIEKLAREAIKSTENLDKSFQKVTRSSQRLNYAWLGVGFSGKMLAQTFGFLNKELMNVYFAGELLNIQLTMLWSAAPMLEPLVDVFYGLADAFYALPEPIQGAIGMLSIVLSTFGELLSGLGFAMIGIQSAGMAFSGLWVVLQTGVVAVGTAMIPLLTLIGVFIAILGALWVAWHFNLGNIRKFAEEVWGAIIQGLEIVMGIIDGLMTIIMGIFEGDWNTIKEGIWKVLDGISRFFMEFVAGLIGAAVRFGIRITTAIWNWLGKLPGLFVIALMDVGNHVHNFFIYLSKLALDAGVNFVTGLIKGIASMASQVATALWNLIPEPFKGWLEGVATGVGKIISGITDFVSPFIPGPTRTDFIMRPGQPAVPFSSKDTIIGTQSGMGAGTIILQPTINISGVIRSSADARDYGREIMDGMYGELRRRRM